MRVLVAGGAGFIGSHLCDRLLSDGHQVFALDNFQAGNEDNLKDALRNPNFTLIRGDVRDAIPDCGAERIYNLACPASPRQYAADPIGTFRTNVVGILNLLEYCQKNGARLLQGSTSEVYGEANVHPQPESYVGSVNCIGPRACYHEGKRAAETACSDYERQAGVQVRIARLFNVYGPRMTDDGGRVVPGFIMQALSGEPLTIYGAGAQTRSFCYIDDTIEALVRLMEVEGTQLGPVNIGNPQEVSIRELADLVIRKTGSNSPLVYESLPNDDPRLRRPDIEKATSLLDWQPSTTLEEGLETTISWHRQQMGELVADGSQKLVIIGGGPAGLTAGYYALRESEDLVPIVLEETDMVGGIARTESYKGYLFDIGGHRFFTKVRQVEELWREVLTEEFLRRPRLSRIFYRGKYYAYPLKAVNALTNLGMYESLRILLSYAKWRVKPYKDETNFEQWVTNRFGGRLFWHFFKSYTEKVWGMPCTTIQADWAAQRIKNLSLRKAVWNAFTGANDTTSLIEAFDYPRLGPGMMWEAFRDKIRAKGGEVRMNSRATRVFWSNRRVSSVVVATVAGESYRLPGDHFISSMPISELIACMDPPAPEPIRAAAKRLRYRDFLIVTLILKRSDLFPDNWIYIHSPNVEVGRIQNFRSWSEHMLPDQTTSSIGMEYFCQEGDKLWTKDNATLIKQAASELEHLGLATADLVIDGTVIRQPKAYPVYDEDYQEALDMIRGWLSTFDNLQVVGRNGMHRYNNQDHSMLTAMLAVKNILGGRNDLWAVNVEKEYHEDVEAAPDLKSSQRLARAAA